MGTPKRIRRKYDTPIHPWIKSQIDDEKRVASTYGAKNKREIWKMDTLLKKFKSQAKYLIAATGDQAEVEKQHLFRRMKELGLAGSDVDFDHVLGLTLDDVMKRRLQTIVYEKGLARSPKQARQFITHEHVLVGGRMITSPSYLVTVSEESKIEFAPSSPLYSEQHPERASPEDEKDMKGKAPKMEEASGDASGQSSEDSTDNAAEEEGDGSKASNSESGAGDTASKDTSAAEESGSEEKNSGSSEGEGENK